MQDRIRIILLEDSDDDMGLVKIALKREGISFALNRVDNREDFISALENHKPDVVLSDHALPQFNSIEALKLFKEKDLNIPFILVTGTVSEDFAVNILKQGVDDYILKSNLTRLPSAMLNAIEKRKAERDKAKSDNELRIQYEELKKINLELDHFVYSVSHNLRAPLLSVLGLLDLSKRELADIDVVSPYLDMMQQSIFKLDETLKEILDYSHNGRNEMEFTKIEFEELIQECLSQFSNVKGFDQIEKKVVVNNSIPFYSDRYRLSILVRNLISNAIIFRDLRKDKYQINMQVTVKPDLAQLTVSDNGVGIDPESLPKVFDMFYRAHEKSEGSGLGLYIAREAVNRLKGTIGITSEENEGTEVQVSIPNQATPTY